MILYQDKILNTIKNFTLDTLPHTILIKGDKGSGKHLIAHEFSRVFNLPLIDITDRLDLDTINDIYSSGNLSFYLINTDNISVKEQNTILKFLEEPCSTAFILLLNSNNILLPTVENRCYLIKLKAYTKQELSNFIFDEPGADLIVKISTTPGQIEEYLNSDFIGMFDFANKVFQHIKTANVSNCLTISNKIKFTDKDTDNYELDTFCRILLFISKNISFDVYNLTNMLYNNIKVPHINKRHLFEKYLLELKYII